MNTLTTIPKVCSGYKLLDFAKDKGASYNTDVLHDNLVHTDGIVNYNDGNCDIVAPSSIIDAWHLALDVPLTVAMTDDGYITYYCNGQSTTNNTMSYPNYRCSTVFDYDEPMLIISEGSNGYKFDNGTATSVSNMPQFVCMTEHCGRVFGVANSRVSYSALLDATNWQVALSAGGYIDMPSSIGSCHTIISRGDYLYVIGQCGIVQLYIQSDPGNFKLSVMTCNITNICSGTAVLCGDNIWWLSESGVYQLDGTDVELMLTLDDDVVYDYSSTMPSTYYNGKLIIPIRATFPDNNRIGCEKDSYWCNTLLVIDTHTCTYHLLRGVDIVRAKATNKVALCDKTSNTLLSLGSSIEHRQWTSQQLQLSGHSHKRIDSIVVDTVYPVTLHVASGKHSRSYHIESGRHRVAVRMRGDTFVVSLQEKCQYMNVEPLGIYYTAFGTDETGG